jgi:iron complex transport system substrate-binding protein
MTMNTEKILHRRRLLKAGSAAALAACSTAFSTTPRAQAGTTLTDLAGRSVVLPARVERIVLGEGRLLNTLLLLEDSRDPLARIAGWQGDLRRLDPQSYGQLRERHPKVDAVPLIGNTSEASVSPEKVLSLKPDVAVFSLVGHGPGRRNPLVEQLQATGVPVVFIDFREHPLKNTVPSLRVLGRALQREAQAERFIAFYEAQKKRVTDVVQALPAAQRPRVLLDARAGDAAGVLTAGKGNLGELIDLAGGDNVGATLIPAALGEASLEAVLAARPEVYVATGYQHPQSQAAGVKLGAQVDEAMARDSLLATLKRRPELAALPAVREGRCHAAWHHFYNTPQHVVLLQALAKWIHPARFAALDPTATWREMHRQFLGFEPAGTYWVSAQAPR